MGVRKESYNHDPCKPVVKDDTLEDDQNRCDFIISTVAACLSETRFGELVDPFDDLLDLGDDITRMPLGLGTIFSDDPLRMICYARFVIQLKFFTKDETFETLQHNRKRIEIISGGRIIDELSETMMTDHPSRGFVELHYCGLLEFILPEFALMDIVETRNGQARKNDFYHTLEMVNNIC